VLRITAKVNDNSLSLKLEGRLEGPWVEVLRKSWTDATSRDGDYRTVADLEAVNFADPEGRKLLLTMQKEGVTLTNLSGFMREVLERDGSNRDHNDLE
jgi:hypothetical protein